MRITDKYVFFFGPEDIYSNFFKADFEVWGQKYVSVEQFFHWCKAALFQDWETAEKILKTEDPKEAKKLGRQVKGFIALVWDLMRVDVMLVGVLHKFWDNVDLKNRLRNDRNNLSEIRDFVEASPYDKFWGIGFSEKDADKGSNKLQWGKNQLGRCLNMASFILNYEIHGGEENVAKEIERRTNGLRDVICARN